MLIIFVDYVRSVDYNNWLDCCDIDIVKCALQVASLSIFQADKQLTSVCPSPKISSLFSQVGSVLLAQILL